MAKPILSAEHFQDEAAAFAFLEARIWPDGPVCPKCGAGADHIRKLAGKTTRPGLYKCYACMKPFTVKMGTVFESSHVPLHIWLQTVHLMVSSKKGCSTNQIHRTMGVTLKTAWFMTMRVREAMKTVGVEPLGGAGMTSRQTKPTSAGSLPAELMSRPASSNPSSPWYNAAAGCVAFMCRT